eukprot:m.259748 g.259748  ORF g.259748 m.259748 type:complete len:299 (-) comp17589_c0_seq6:3023-3919(-)
MFQHERQVLAILQQSTTLEEAEASSASTASSQDHFDALKHIPAIVPEAAASDSSETIDTTTEQRWLHLRPVGERLAWSNIRAVHIDQFFKTLEWLHTTKKRLHHDVSYRNILLASANWLARTTSKEDSITIEQSIMLIDWEFSVPIEDSTSDARGTGTPITMSQRQLLVVAQRLEPAKWTVPPLSTSTSDEEAGADSVSEAPPPSFVYGVSDELEAAVKSILLVLSPALKRRLKRRGAPRLESHDVYMYVHDVWQRVIPQHIFELCQKAEYQALSNWLKTEIAHFDPAEEAEYVECHT